MGFEGGGGVETFLELTDTPATYVGQALRRPRVNAGETALEFTDPPESFAPTNTFFVDAGGQLPSFDGVSYTTVQSAITAAVALTPGVLNQFLVWIAPGIYNEGTLVLNSWVHLAGMGNSGDDTQFGSVTIQLGGGAAHQMDSVDQVKISGIYFDYNGGAVGTALLFITHANIVFQGCVFNLTTSGGGVNVMAGGRFLACRFEASNGLQLFGSRTIMPVFIGCQFQGCPFTTGGSTSYARITGGQVQDGTVVTASPNVVFDGVAFVMRSTSTAVLLVTASRFQGCSFDLRQEHSLASQVVDFIQLTGGARFDGCNFIFTDNRFGGGTNKGVFKINDLSADIAITGCSIETASFSNAMFFLSTGITTSTFSLILNANTVRCNTTSGPGLLFAADTAGFTGTAVIVMNGNYFEAGVNALPTNASTGRIVWRGSDVKSEFALVGPGTGTLVTIDDYTAQKLSVVAETAFILGRTPPPGAVLVDAGLVLSANNSDGLQLDAFTDANGTAIAAHVPTGDATSSWTLVDGTLTIESNKASGDATSGLNTATYSVVGSNGKLKCVATADAGTGTNSAGVMFRRSDASNYWRIVNEEGAIKLIKRVAAAETTVATITGGSTEVAFKGDRITVYNGSGVIVAEFFDSDLESGTIVGLYTNGLSGRNQTIDDFDWNPGGDVDLTIDTDHAAEMEIFGSNAATAVDAGVDVFNRAYTFLDLPVGTGADLWNAKVTLDALNGNIDEVYIHGIQYRVLPLQSPGMDSPLGFLAR